jgi:lysine 2,3-aminomutase
MKDKFLKKVDDLSRAEKRRVSNERAEELKGRIDEYMRAREEIVFAENVEEDFLKNRDQILEVLNADLSDWNNWHWQLQNRVNSVELLQKIFDITELEVAEIKEVEKKYRWAVSPYFLALIDWEDKDCPIRKQAIPTPSELKINDSLADPMAEKAY